MEKSLDRSSHVEFLSHRNWESVCSFWRSLFRSRNLPKFVSGNEEFGITNLIDIHNVGLDEYSSDDPRFKRKTFSLRIGYLGSSFSGYQSQKGTEGVRTVEEDLFHILGGRTCVAAGRTDKDVSAISQIISFNTFDDINPEGILEQCLTHTAVMKNEIAVYECLRVPRKFNALFSASWRRYLYLFPLCRGNFDGFDVDVSFVNAALNRVQGKELPYDAFAYRDSSSNSVSDLCTLYRAKCFLVDMIAPEEEAQSVADDNMSNKGPSIVSENTIGGQYECAGLLCIELVGDRFLRRMVRILSATVLREAALSTEDRNVKIIEEVCLTGNRNRAAFPLPGVGLCMAGVGFDLEDLATTKRKKKSQMSRQRAIPAIGSSTLESSGSSFVSDVTAGQIEDH